MGRDLQNISQYQLTNDIIKNHYVFDIKDGALKVLLILSTHYPNILINRKSLINRYKIPQRTVDRALKELEENQLIERQNGSNILLNVAMIYCHIGKENVVNLAKPCNNQHNETEKDNKHDNVAVSLLKGFSFSDDEIHRLTAKHSTESLQMYAKYVQNKKADDPKRYLQWCLKEKPAINDTKSQQKSQSQPITDVERYTGLLSSEKMNFLNSLSHAQTYLVNTNEYDLRNEIILKDCIAIMLHWKLQIQDYNALILIDEAAANNEAFRQKTVNLTAKVMNDLKTAKLTVDRNGLDKEQIAC